jgi:hypothetical protein
VYVLYLLYFAEGNRKYKIDRDIKDKSPSAVSRRAFFLEMQRIEKNKIENRD